MLAAVSLVWTPENPFRTDPFHQWERPSAAHWFGTDGVGRDIASYLLAGTRTTLVVAVGAGRHRERRRHRPHRDRFAHRPLGP